MNKIRRFAEKKDITLMELAEKIGISNIRMLKIANEETPLRPIETLNLLIYFDCKPSELFGNAFEGFFDEYDREKMISHLQIIHIWATFALEHMDENFFKEKHMQKIAEWTEEALDLLKEEKK